MPLIAEVRKVDAKMKILVTDGNPNCQCKDLGDFFYPVDIFDLDANIKLLNDLQFKGFEFKGILAAGLEANYTMAVLNNLAGLKAVSPLAAYIAHHKPVFRAFLQQHGLPCPKWREARNEKELKEAVQYIGFPLIIKNIDSSGSRGTKKFFKKPAFAALLRAFKEAVLVSTTKTALVEELLFGQEQTTEGLFDIHGKFHRTLVTGRVFDRKSPWATELHVEHPDELSEQDQGRLYDLLEKTARLLGITTGTAKGDTMITKKGPVLIEMTTRLSGGFDCQYLVPLATGKNVLRAAILTAMGKPFDKKLLVDTKHRVTILDSLWPKPGERIVAIEGLEKAKKLPGFELFSMRSKIGSVVEPYVDSTKRVCFIIVSGRNRLEARANMKRILDVIAIKTK